MGTKGTPGNGGVWAQTGAKAYVCVPGVLIFILIASQHWRAEHQLWQQQQLQHWA